MTTYLKQLVHGLATAAKKVHERIRALVRLPGRALRRRRRRTLEDQLEAERLDRLRHPSKYLGR